MNSSKDKLIIHFVICHSEITTNRTVEIGFVTFEKFSMGKVFEHLKHFKDVGWVGVPMTKSTKTAGENKQQRKKKRVLVAISLDLCSTGVEILIFLGLEKKG